MFFNTKNWRELICICNQPCHGICSKCSKTHPFLNEICQIIKKEKLCPICSSSATANPIGFGSSFKIRPLPLTEILGIENRGE